MTNSPSVATRLVEHGRFPHPVGNAECIETHASWIVLAGEHAYKIKKPLDLGFLDYSTPARRRAMCEEELRLNRRSAPEIYEAVVGIRDGEAPAVCAPDGADEFAVRMRRFDQSALFARLLEAGRLNGGHMDAVARHVAEFHASADVAMPGGEFGTADAVIFPVQQNFDQMRELVSDAALLERIARLQEWSAGESRRLTDTFDARLAGGFVRECHGDLHLANIVWLEERARLFDGIEFNPQLRWNDVVADVAFLVMDCEARGRADLAHRFLDAWLEAAGDYEGLALLGYYVVYRAMVRAKVAAIRMGQESGEAARARGDELSMYLDYALARIAPTQGRVWIASGPSGAGKSTQGRVLVERCGAIRIRSDVERKRLAGLAVSERATAAVGEGLYGPEMTKRTYARLEDIVRAVVAAGRPAMVDATFLKRAQRDEFRALATELDVPFAILAFDAPPHVLRERVTARAEEGGDAADADVTVLEHQLATREPLGEDEHAVTIEIDTSRHVEWDALLERLLTRP